MKSLRTLTLLALVLILLAIGLNHALSGLWGLGADPVFSRLLGWLPEGLHPQASVEARRGWGILILGLMLAWLVLSLVLWLRRPRALRVRSTGGTIMQIHPGALIKFVRLQVESHPAVVDSRVRVRQAGGNSVSIRALVHVQPIESLPVINEQIRSMIRDGLTHVMGIEKIDDIQLTLDIDEKNLGVRPGAMTEPEAEPVPPPRARVGEGAAEGAAADEIPQIELNEPQPAEPGDADRESR